MSRAHMEGEAMQTQTNEINGTIEVLGVRCEPERAAYAPSVKVWVGYGDRMRVSVTLYPDGLWHVHAFVQRRDARTLHEGAADGEGATLDEAHDLARDELAALLASFAKAAPDEPEELRALNALRAKHGNSPLSADEIAVLLTAGKAGAQ
jgi:hypothetical protein